MAAPRVLISSISGPRAVAPHRPDAVHVAWGVLGWVGLTFAIIGLLDLALAWYPPAFGSPEWEFGVVTATLNGLTVPAIGLMLLLASGIARGNRLHVRVVSITLMVAAITLLGLGVLFITVAPLALRDVTNALARTGLIKAIAKSVGLLLIYPGVFGWAALLGMRHTRR